MSSARKYSKEEPDLSEKYPISVVIPAYNRAAELARCLQGLAANDLSNTEVLVVDDASSQELQEALGQLQEAECLQRLIRHPTNRGPASARNTGLAHSAHPFIFFLDADVVLPPQALQWIRETLDLYRHRPEVAGVLGSYSEARPRPDDFWTDYKNLATCHLYAATETVSPYLHTPMLCLRKDVLEEAGGFDPSFETAEDFRLGVLLGSRGYRFIIDRRIRGFHLKRYHLQAILREDARRLRDLGRLDLSGPQQLFALRAHRLSRIVSLATPGLSLAILLLAPLAPRLLWLLLGLLMLFWAVNLPLASYLRKRRGFLFAWKARLALFLEMLWAEYCLLANLLRKESGIRSQESGRRGGFRD